MSVNRCREGCALRRKLSLKATLSVERPQLSSKARGGTFGALWLFPGYYYAKKTNKAEQQKKIATDWLKINKKANKQKKIVVVEEQRKNYLTKCNTTLDNKKKLYFYILKNSLIDCFCKKNRKLTKQAMVLHHNCIKNIV